MAFLFGKPNIPQPDPKLAGLGPEDTNTNEQARPLPWFSGVARMQVTWMAPAYNVRTVAIKRKAGKKKTTVGYGYYAGVAGLVCAGPVDKIKQIWMNRELVWDGSITRSSDYATITIETRGQFRIYWGTATQDVDDLLLDGVADAHPPYRNQCYIVCPDLYWGENSTTAPSIEVVIERHPRRAWGTAAQELSRDHNPAYAAAEWLQDPIFGLGLPDSRIDTASFETEAASFADDTAGISPMLDKQQSVRQLFQQLGEYTDLWLGTTDEGKFRIKKPSAFPAITNIQATAADDMEEAPRITFDSWEQASTSTWIRYKNRDREFKEDAVAFRDQGALNIIAAHKSQTLQRPWITRNDLAEKLVSKTGRIAAVPGFAGRVRVLDTEAIRINLGGLIRFTWAESGLTNFVGIVESIIVPGPGSTFWQIEFRTWHNDLYNDNATPIGVLTPPAETVIEVVDLYDSAVTELPLGLATQSDITFAPLLVRGDSLTTGANVWLNQGGSTYDQIAQVGAFCVKGRLSSVYTYDTDIHDTSGDLRVILQSPEKGIETQTLTQAQSNNLLMIINPGLSTEEIVSIQTPVLVSGTTYSFSGIRSRYDTRRRTHSTVSDVFIIERALLEQIYDSNTIAAGSNYTLKFQPYLGSQEFDLASVTAVTTPTAAGRAARVQAPIHTTLNGSESGITYDSATDDIALSWDHPDGWISGDEYVIEFYDQNENTLFHTRTVTGTSTTLTNGDMNTYYSGYPTKVVVYLKGKRVSDTSIFFDKISATKL